MPVHLSEDQKRIISEAREFALTEIKPRAKAIDREGCLPKDLIYKLAERKLLGATFPESLGGLGFGPVAYGLLTEELGKYCANIRNLFTVHTSIVGQCLLEHGNSKQIDKWIPPMIKGEKIGAFSITEPEVGSDAKNINTCYRKDGTIYIINGKKKWTTLGAIADFFLIAAKNEDKMTVFIVEKEIEGIYTKQISGLIGSRASYLAEIELKNVAVSEENILGDITPGINRVVNTAFDHARYSVAWGAVALSKACLESMIDYSKNREQFGKKIRSYQLIQEFICNAAVNIRAARALCMEAAEARQRKNTDAEILTVIAKYFCSRAAVRIAEDAVQIHGANGCCDEYPVERYFREAKILEIIEGTTQILGQLIAGMALIERI